MAPRFSQAFRMLLEKQLKWQINNVVATRGIDRIERHETLTCWKERLRQAGFQSVQLWSSKLKDCSLTDFPEFRIVQNNGFPTLCLPNRPVAVVSVWKPDNRTQLINNIGGKRMIDDLHYPVTIQDRGKSPIGTCGLETICEGRKEKLGEKITTIQGLVCPFGKTETASVLFECIEYIRFLHEQIQILSSPYLGTASSSMRIQQKSVHGERNCAFLEHPVQDSQDKAKDLRSRGLCLVSVSHSVVQMGQNNIGGGF
ncbi:uncharacterized protein [Populus alba]|uniref:uncharacterized protein n=1 Tax=Populus alba TaxID=43335 RepID=UPI003CC7520C